MRVIIVTWAGEFCIEVSPQEPVLEIKSKVEQLLGIPVSSQILSVSELELIDGLDMEDYPIITDGTKIHLAINYSNKIHIIIKFAARQISIDVDTTETVRSLKEKIHIINGTPIKKMILFFSGIEMEEDFRNLSEYGIHEFSEIVVLIKTTGRVVADPPSRRLHLVVQTSSSLLNSARIPLETKDSSSINELRELLVGRKILPEDDYIFIHKQRIMRENCSLRWHGVEDGDVLYIFKGTVSRDE